MISQDLWVFIHILLFTCWLGADFGVFVLARRARDPALSFEQRSLLLQMAMKIDFTPRIAFVLMLPAGVQLGWMLGYLHPSLWLPATAWVVAGLWLILTIQIARGGPHVVVLHRLHFILLLVLALSMLAAAALAWSGVGTLTPAWLAGKLALYGVICLLAIGIDWAFQPVAAGFARLAQDGGNDEVETLISGGIDGTIRFVVALYAALLLAAFLGVFKPGW
jgi:hypothetical protein